MDVANLITAFQSRFAGVDVRDVLMCGPSTSGKTFQSRFADVDVRHNQLVAAR